jgi:hypothetical protein
VAIYHDSYLFKSEELEKEISPYIEPLKNSRLGYSSLRAYSLEVFQSHAHVQKMSSEYGGWDMAGLLTLPAEQPNTPQDIAFWMIIFVYDAFYRTQVHELGLGTEQKLLQEFLQAQGWNYQDTMLLLHGKSFAEFAVERFHKNDEFWSYLHPNSTSSWAGWIPRHEIKRLSEMLPRSSNKLQSVTIAGKNNVTPNAVETILQKAQQMLISALEADCDLGIIISG